MNASYLSGGWQFDVFLLSNNRVHKQQKPFFVRYIKGIGFKTGFLCFNPIILFHRFFAAFVLAPKSLLLVKEKLSLHPHLLIYFGNPEFLGSICYEQDYVTPVAEIFDKLLPHEKARLMREFIFLTRKFWRYGMSDGDLFRFENFLKNYGIDAKGNLVLIDLGILTSDKTYVVQMLGDVHKTSRHVPCSELILRYLNEESLRKIWNTAW